MKITVWGARGSIPSPGPHTMRYGGNTTCLEIRPRSDDAVIIIDAGSGMRLLGKHLLGEAQQKPIYLFLTHAHWDHLQGFPFFTPGYFSRYHITICSGPLLQGGLRLALEKQMTPPCFPVDFSMMKAQFAFAEGETFVRRIGSLAIAYIPLSHPNGGYGFKFSEDGRDFVFLTDNEPTYPHPGGLATSTYADFCRGAALLMHDAQYTDEEYRLTRGWGHSTYADAVDLALAAEVEQLGLFHHDPDRHDDELERLARDCHARLTTARPGSRCFAVAEGETFEL